MPPSARAVTFGVVLLCAAVADALTKLTPRPPVNHDPYHNTPLDAYIQNGDPTFDFYDSGLSVTANGWTAYYWNLTSQAWLTPQNSSRPIWWHQLAIIIPHDVVMTRGSAFMYITGNGNNNPGWPGSDDEDLAIAAAVAVSAQSPAAVLWQVPNQPIEFPVDPFQQSRSEDAAIALTWWYYVTQQQNPNWVLELPMTKAGVRALDALEQILPTYLNGHAVGSFAVAGASKRGWTTWLVGAVDNRVFGILPIVLDALNVVEFAHRQFQFYGAWTFALQDYWQMNFTQNIDMPQTAAMMSFIDPWYYRARLTMPKLAMNAVGDEFQMPDDQRYWAHQMSGEMNLIMVKNAEHSMATGVFEVIQAASAFVTALQNNVPRPNYTWSIDATSGDITVTTTSLPESVDIAYAYSPQGVSTGRRDFRWAALNVSFCPIHVFGACVRPVLWETTQVGLTQVTQYQYTAHMAAPATGWAAFMIELQWPNSAGPNDFYFTSPVSVVPNTLPFPPCQGTACKGTLC